MTAFDQSQPEFWHDQGCQLCETEQYTAAIAAFDRAIALNPGNCKAWSNRGNALSGMKRQAEALHMNSTTSCQAVTIEAVPLQDRGSRLIIARKLIVPSIPTSEWT